MPFRPKTEKKIVIDKKAIITLDGKHSEMVDNIKYIEYEKIPALQQNIKLLKLQLSTSTTIEEQLEIKDNIKLLRSQIKTFKQDNKNYYLNTSKYIFEYFEQKKNISDGNMTDHKLEKCVSTHNVKVLDAFFKVNSAKDNSDNDITKSYNNSDKDDNIVKKYLETIDDSFLDVNNFISYNDVCRTCNKGELIPVEHDGILVCNKCGNHFQYLIENEKPSYKEPPKEVCFYAYKRINHFREILAQFQAKETTQIPEEVLNNIKSQIKKERINIDQLNNKKAKEILKKLGYNKYYEHIPFIKDKLGIKPPIMSIELEDKLCNLFIDIQAPYSKYCPDDRVNFLNYYYTVYKLCELLNQSQFLPYFPMLKDREKRIEQDDIWKKICEELKWEFIPTV